MDKAFYGYARWDYCRWGIYNTVFEDLMRTFRHYADYSLTRQILVLANTVDSITGWFISYYQNIPIEGLLFSKDANRTALKLGTYVRNDALLCTCDPIREDDRILDSSNRLFEVVTVTEKTNGDDFLYRECQLHKLPIQYALPSYGTGASVDDPRKRTRTWLNIYVDSGNLLENDASTYATYLSCWSIPPYGIERTFVDKNVDLVFLIKRGTSKPLVDSTHYTIGYEEKISVFPSAIDKTNISGENLMWQGERELRRIAENYPLGSLRNFETMEPQTQQLGSTTLYTVECVLGYTRDTT
jgi:hypothetical protein